MKYDKMTALQLEVTQEKKYEEMNQIKSQTLDSSNVVNYIWNRLILRKIVITMNIVFFQESNGGQGLVVFIFLFCVFQIYLNTYQFEKK